MRLASIEQAHEPTRIEKELTGHDEAIPKRTVESLRASGAGSPAAPMR